ncbi:MAG: STAS domain-containing protein [Candidatus Krumholzibacteriota bacterium]|nr:STAS domain-containing protein [Candidatus Krumholzibacteriota bacterium]
MFDIRKDENGIIKFQGKLDASKVEKARAVLDAVTGSASIDFGELDYISSAGLGILLATQRRLMKSDDRLKLLNLNQHIRNIFKIAGFDLIFDIE